MKTALTAEEMAAVESEPGLQGQRAELDARLATERAAEERALAVPLPGGLVEAMEPSVLARAGLSFQPVVAAHLGILQKLDAGFYRKCFIEKTTALTIEDVCVALYVFTGVPAALRQTLEKRGREGFVETAMSVIGDVMAPWDLPVLEAALVEHLEASQGTRVALATTDVGSLGDKEENPLVPLTQAKP